MGGVKKLSFFELLCVTWKKNIKEQEKRRFDEENQDV